MSAVDVPDWSRSIQLVQETALTVTDYADWTVAAEVVGVTASAAAGLVPSDKPTAALAQTYSRYLAISDVGTTATEWMLSAINLTTGTVVSNISFVTGNTGAGGAQTHWFYGLFDSGVNALAFTGDQLTAALAANTVKTLAVATVAGGAASSYTITANGVYYLGFYMAGSVTTLVGPPGLRNPPENLAPSLGGNGATRGTPFTPPGFPYNGGPITADNPVYAYVS